MRAVFTIDLPSRDEDFPPDAEIMILVRRFGWEFKDMPRMTREDIKAIMRAQGSGRSDAATEGERLQSPKVVPIPKLAEPQTVKTASVPDERIEAVLREHYKRLAAELFVEMPEVAGAERDAVIFSGYIAGDQTLFVVTRMVPGQITFRLLHRELTRLQTSTEKMMRKVLGSSLGDEPFHVQSPIVNVYERMFDHVIITGRVITDVWKETLRSNLKDALLFAVPLGLFIPTLYVLLRYPQDPAAAHDFWHGTLERLSTALLTTALVSALGLLQTLIEVRRGRIIDWSVPKDRKR